MLPRDERLTRRRDFEAVYGRGREATGARSRSWANPLLVLYVRRQLPPDVSAGSGPETGETRRFGFSVSKKVGKAHDRNRVKRRLRDICRRHGSAWGRGFDAVFIARSASATAEYSELEDAVRQLVERAGLLARGQRTGPAATDGTTDAG